MTRRRHGFTLIELLVVIAIIALLITILMPAVLQAKQTVKKMLTKTQIAALSAACGSYHEFFDAYPGVIANPPDAPSGSTPSMISGSQNLRLALMGCSRSGGTSYSPQYQGPADDIDQYSNSKVRKYDQLYTPRPNEKVAHSAVYSKNSALDSGYSGTIEVFVDFHLTPPRPLLYFRAQPAYVNSNRYEFDDNAVYCLPDKGEVDTSASFQGRYYNATAKEQDYIIVSAGPDRVFFTADDLDNVQQN